jgi:hypothetical protein
MKENQVDRASAMNGGIRKAYGILVGEPYQNRTLGRYGSTWEDNIKIDLREIE